jgi:hypothetical protein
LVRAPNSVTAAGWEFDSSQGYWRLNKETRQIKLWQQVSRQETRSGERPSNSLKQVMEEDSHTSTGQRTIKTITEQSLRIHREQNGILIALDGQPLVTEFFSNPLGIQSTIWETIRAASFDANSLDYHAIGREEVERFFEEIRNAKTFEVDSNDWGILLAGGTSGVDARISMSSDEQIMYLSALNRDHRVLLEV